jgi:hypothetical protein
LDLRRRAAKLELVDIVRSAGAEVREYCRCRE